MPNDRQPLRRLLPVPPALAVWRLLLSALLSFADSARSLAKRMLGLGGAEVQGKVVLVTGAAQGIGLATAELFAKNGCVTVLTDISPQVHDAAKSLCDRGHRAVAYQLNVTNPKEARECADEVAQRFGRVDILVSNAGVLHGKPLLQLSEDQIRATFDVNTLGTVWVTRAVLPHMIRRRSGHIVSVVSMSACRGVAYLTDYSACKQACVGFFEALEDELRRMDLPPDAVRLSMIFPTFIDPQTGILQRKRLTPVSGQLLQPSEVAEKIVNAVRYNRRFVCLPEQAWLAFALKGLTPWRIVREVQDISGQNFNAD